MTKKKETVVEEAKKETTDETIVEENEVVEEIKEVEMTEEEKLQKEKDEINEKFFRLTAEFQNYKRRTETEKKDIYAYANEKIIVDLLAVVDNYDRAMANLDKDVDESLTKGIHMIYNQLVKILKKFGLDEIEAVDAEFDHNFHHAVMQEEVEGQEGNIVTDVLQKGYTLNKKVIRASMVKVSK